MLASVLVWLVAAYTSAEKQLVGTDWNKLHKYKSPQVCAAKVVQNITLVVTQKTYR